MKEMLKKMSTKKLCELFVMTGTMNDENIPTVRGWIMDEVESRNPEGYDAWLDDDASEDADLYRYVA